MTTELKKLIEDAWEDRQLLEYKDYQDAIETTILKLDKGELRVAEPIGNRWHVNHWIKKAVILYFPIRNLQVIEAGPFVFYDKMKLKTNFKEAGVQVAPQGLARYGSFLGKGVILMPSYVNVGAYVDEGTLVDTWATVGSCAQIGKNVHLSTGVDIGGSLETAQASPVIIEDNCFIGSRSIVTEGIHVGQEAILSSNVVLTASTKIIDVTGDQPVEYKSFIPARSIVIPSTYTKRFPSGEFQVPCALVIGKRKESTDKKSSLNDALREHNVAV